MKYKKKLDLESEDYRNKLNEDETNFLDKFNYDYKYGGAYSKDSELSDEGKTEGKANHRSFKYDALTVATNKGALADLNEADREFMEVACDEWDWQHEFKLHGYKAAVKLIYSQTETDIKNTSIDFKTTLTRFYSKMISLKRIYSKERKRNAKKT